MEDALRATLAFNLAYLHEMLEHVPAEQMTVQPTTDVGRIRNHPAWQLGHLADTCFDALGFLGKEAIRPEHWNAWFGMGSDPAAGPAQTGYPDADALWQTFIDVRQRAIETFFAADESTLNAATPDDVLRPYFPTVRDAVLYMLIGHEATHLGELSAWRKAMGYPPLS